jgi:hypothetical protein
MYHCSSMTDMSHTSKASTWHHWHGMGAQIMSMIMIKRQVQTSTFAQPPKGTLSLGAASMYE